MLIVRRYQIAPHAAGVPATSPSRAAFAAQREGLAQPK
jgi:hypothetical protein